MRYSSQQVIIRCSYFEKKNQGNMSDSEESVTDVHMSEDSAACRDGETSRSITRGVAPTVSLIIASALSRFVER